MTKELMTGYLLSEIVSRPLRAMRRRLLGVSKAIGKDAEAS